MAHFKRRLAETNPGIFSWIIFINGFNIAATYQIKFSVGIGHGIFQSFFGKIFRLRQLSTFVQKPEES